MFEKKLLEFYAMYMVSSTASSVALKDCVRNFSLDYVFIDYKLPYQNETLMKAYSLAKIPATNASKKSIRISGKKHPAMVAAWNKLTSSKISEYIESLNVPSVFSEDEKKEIVARLEKAISSDPMIEYYSSYISELK